MRRVFVSAIVVLLLPVVAACSDDSDACVEGTSAPCTCSNGSLGARTCLSDGTFGDCLCEDGRPDAGAPANDAAIPDGSGDVCAAAIDCPPPAAGGYYTLCGQIFDIETGTALRAAAPAGEACDPAAPTDSGPCALQLAAYDALGFAANPNGTAPQDASEFVIDDCGRFRAVDVEPTFSGFIAIGLDDSSAGATDAFVNTAVTTRLEIGERIEQIAAYATSRTTDAAWTNSAGDPYSPATFSERGLFVAIYLHGDAPVEGVAVTDGAGDPIPSADVWYFADEDGTATRRNIDVAAPDTGPNGAALVVDPLLQEHSGIGAEPAGCEWPSRLARSPPNAVWVEEMRAHGLGDPDAACP